MKKVIKKLFVLSLLIVTVFCLNGCMAGVVSEEKYAEIFVGVTCEFENGNSIYYQMKTLVDNAEFNPLIQSKAYNKINLLVLQDCKIRAIAFIVRSSDNCTLSFTAMLEEEMISITTKNFSKERTSDVLMSFESAISCNSNSNFYIEIEEQNKEDKNETDFKFDSLIIFLQE